MNFLPFELRGSQKPRPFETHEGSATRKSDVSSRELTYCSGIIQQSAFARRKETKGCATRQASSMYQQTRSYTFDDLSRMTSETNPETGTIYYFFDSDPGTRGSANCPGTYKGDLVKEVDATGDVICNTYDALHRNTSTTYPAGTYSSVTPSKYFVYDAATINTSPTATPMTLVAGRLAEAYTCYSPCSSKLTDIGLTYTPRGEVSDRWESTPHSGTYYHSYAQYWANGALSALGDSGTNGFASSYSVDGEGRIKSTGSGNLTNTTYNNASQPTQVNYGSGDSDSFTYSNVGQMAQYSYNVNGQSVVGNLTWNPLGTLASLAITDPFTNRSII